MRKNLLFGIGGIVLFALAQIPAFLAWTVYVGPWDTGLADMEIANAIIGSVFIIVLGAIIFAAGAFAVMLIVRLSRRILGREGKPDGWVSHLMIAAGIVVGCGLAAALEFGAVTLMKTP